MPYIKTQSKTDWFYDIKGEGQPLVLIHGWSFDSDVWFKQTISLKDYRVVVLDLPGHGSSGYKKEINLIEDLKSIIDKLELKDFYLIGHSLGGLLALKLTFKYPGLAKKLVLIGATAKFIKSDGYEQGLEEGDVKKLRGFLSDSYPNILLVFIRWLFTKRERSQSDFGQIWDRVAKRSKWPDRGALDEFLSIIESEDLREELKKIDIPTLVISGTNDPICPRVSAEYLNRQIKGSKLELFDDCGHLPFLTKAERFNKLVSSFLGDF